MESFTRIITTAVAAAILLAAKHGAAAADDAPHLDVVEAIPGLLARYQRHSDIPIPDLTPADFATLASGLSVVYAGEESDDEAEDDIESMGLFALQVVDAPRLLVWVTTLGGGGGRARSEGRYHSALLENGPYGSYARFQYVNLPWPIKDRHWVIYTDKNLELADATDGTIWEHRWVLHENGERLLLRSLDDGRISGLSKNTLNGSVYLPANRGTWAIFDLGQDKTLILAFYDADLGGRLPGGLVRSFTRRQIKKFLEAGDARARNALERYREDSQVHDGYGLPVLRDDVIDVDREWRKQQ